MENQHGETQQSQPSLKAYKNIIFDIDGTLVDSNDAHAQAFLDAFQVNDITHIGFDDIRQLIGMDGKTLLSHVLDVETFAEKGDVIDLDRSRIYRERYLPGVKPFPGVRALFQRLRQAGLRLVLCSASEESLFKPLLPKLEISDLIEGWVGNEAVAVGKPESVIIEACCEKFGFLPAETLMVGDTPYDVIAAHGFSVETIAVLTGGYRRADLEKTGALWVVNHVDELTALWPTEAQAKA